MAFVFRNQFDDVAAQRVYDFYHTLSEKDGRRFAAFESQRLGRGGVPYLADLLGCSTRTIERGVAELDQLADDPAAGRIRRPGAGRKKKMETEAGLEDNLNEMLQTRTAGDPDEEDGIFTDRSAAEVARRVSSQGTPVSDRTVTRWFKGLGLGYRKIVKSIAGGPSPDREAQFDHIEALIEEHTATGNPCFSVDTKAKERLGQLYRAGRVLSTTAFHAFGHDFPSWADGVLIPHGIYDPVRNCGHINLGLSHSMRCCPNGITQQSRLPASNCSDGPYLNHCSSWTGQSATFTGRNRGTGRMEVVFRVGNGCSLVVHILTPPLPRNATSANSWLTDRPTPAILGEVVTAVFSY